MSVRHAPKHHRPTAWNMSTIPAPRLFPSMLACRSLLVVLLSVSIYFTESYAQSDTQDRCFKLQATGRPSSRQFWSDFTSEQVGFLEKLNRQDRRYMMVLDSAVVPCEWGRSELEYSPLPRVYPEAKAADKLIIVDKEWQVFGAYEWGELVRWGPVSSGRRTMRTPQGLYHLNWRSKGRHSTVNPRWYLKWYFNFENRQGLSFHQYALPGRPASHACIRLLDRDARWVYGWGEEWRIDRTGRIVLRKGTPLLVVERFDFESRPPWRIPDALQRGATLPPLPDLN